MFYNKNELIQKMLEIYMDYTVYIDFKHKDYNKLNKLSVKLLKLLNSN